MCINRKAILIIKHSHNVMNTYKLHCLASSFPCSNSSQWHRFCLSDTIMLQTPSCTHSVRSTCQATTFLWLLHSHFYSKCQDTLKRWAMACISHQLQRTSGNVTSPREQRHLACTTEPLWVQIPDIHPTKVLPSLFPAKRAHTAISIINPACVGNPLVQSTIHISV